jgi:hypothetical protein
MNPTQEDGIAFRFRLLDGAQAVAQQHGARVYFLDAAGAQQFEGKGGFRRRSGETINVPSTNTSAAVKLTFADNLSTADLVDAGWVCICLHLYRIDANSFDTCRCTLVLSWMITVPSLS